MRFSKVRQLLANFQFIPSSSLDFQVGLNLDETTPLSNHTSVDAVFQLMHKRHVSLAQLVQVLDEMQRFDTLRGVLLNYRSRAVAREFLKTSFSGKPF